MSQQVTFQGKAEDGRQWKFANSAGAVFNAYVGDSLEPTLASMAAGTAVNIEVEQKTSKTGNTYTQVKSLNGERGRKIGGAPGGGAKPASYSPKRFVEAVCTAAIQSGMIKKPEDLDPWAKHAFGLISSLEVSTVRDQIGSGAAATPPAAPSATPQPPNDAIPF